MRIVYRSILEEVQRAINSAAQDNRTIERIEMTQREIDELSRECRLVPVPGRDGFIGSLFSIPVVKIK